LYTSSRKGGSSKQALHRIRDGRMSFPKRINYPNNQAQKTHEELNTISCFAGYRVVWLCAASQRLLLLPLPLLLSLQPCDRSLLLLVQMVVYSLKVKARKKLINRSFDVLWAPGATLKAPSLVGGGCSPVVTKTCSCQNTKRATLASLSRGEPLRLICCGGLR
jgi:hypothetical protein